MGAIPGTGATGKTYAIDTMRKKDKKNKEEYHRRGSGSSGSDYQ